ncbi:hypothetical protein [Candidatus Tisiphia endosymbiont of Temnostethus pusillus]|uniref:hypothetical protein n=1 Tax=Candidatus Tisiphia endosymbiont of Temnostethus pusillus TaxID=3139335 RepID=UPI0035C886ED
MPKNVKKVTKFAKNLGKIAIDGKFSVTPSSSYEDSDVPTRCITLIFSKFK